MDAAKLDNRGYTLIEVMVAFGLLMVFFLAITSLMTTSLNGMYHIMYRQAAEQVCDTVIDNLRLQSHREPVNDSGVIVIEGRSYSWNSVIRGEEVHPGMSKYYKLVKVEVEWSGPQGSKRLERETYVTCPGVANPSPYPQP